MTAKETDRGGWERDDDGRRSERELVNEDERDKNRDRGEYETEKGGEKEELE